MFCTATVTDTSIVMFETTLIPAHHGTQCKVDPPHFPAL